MADFDRDEAIISHGKKLEYSDDIVTPSYTKVAGTVDLTLPERELGASEITNDDSEDFHKDYIPGMYEPGTASFTYRYSKSAFTTMEAIYQRGTVATTRGSGAGGAVMLWKQTLPDGSTAVFKGFITAHNLPVEGSDDSPIVEGEMQIIGKVAWTAGA